MILQSTDPPPDVPNLTAKKTGRYYLCTFGGGEEEVRAEKDVFFYKTNENPRRANATAAQLL